MMYKLRKYQQEGYDKIYKKLTTQNNFEDVAVFPTGAGKSLIIGKLSVEYDEPLLVLQPSKELLEQNYAKFVSYGGEGAVCSASMFSKEVSKVTYGTIGTVKNFWKEFRDVGCRTVILDECHLSSKRKGQLGKFLKMAGITKVIGLTATPVNLKSTINGTSIEILPHMYDNIFTQIIHVTQIQELVKNKFWTPLKYIQKEVDTSKLKVNTSGTDFTEKSIIKMFEENSLDEKVIDSFYELQEQGKKHILIFVPSIEIAQRLQEKCPELGLVHSKQRAKERKKYIESFKSGEVQGMLNVNILATGFDFPEIDGIIVARSTGSFVIYMQQLGRAVRLHPGKKEVPIVDLAGNYERFGKIEDITIEFVKGKWRMYSKDHLLTGYKMNTIGNKVIKRKRGREEDSYESHMKLNFGKHRGKYLHEVPLDYLIWYANASDSNNQRSSFIYGVKDYINTTVGEKVF